MLIEEIIDETRIVWAKRGGKLKKVYRCTNGPRRGRTVASASQCYVPIDIKKRQTLKKTKSKLGPRLQRKAQRTKRYNPVSRRLRTLNIPRR